jgi:hypothetical protein
MHVSHGLCLLNKLLHVLLSLFLGRPHAFIFFLAETWLLTEADAVRAAADFTVLSWHGR